MSRDGEYLGLGEGDDVVHTVSLRLGRLLEAVQLQPEDDSLPIETRQ